MLQERQSDKSEVVVSGDDESSKVSPLQPCRLSFNGESASQAECEMVDAESSMHGRWRKKKIERETKEELTELLREKAKSVPSDSFFNWDMLEDVAKDGDVEDPVMDNS